MPVPINLCAPELPLSVSPETSNRVAELAARGGMSEFATPHAAAIRRDTGIDIYSLDIPEAEKVYAQNIKRYADTYVVTTVTNNSKRPWLFFYVYDSNDSRLMYTYSIQSNVLDKSAKDYSKAAEDFFKQFDETAKKNLSKEERKKLEQKQKEARIYKRHVEKVTYKTGKDKLDMVRKK